MEKNARIYVAGHRGLVGSAIVRKLKDEGYSNLPNLYGPGDNFDPDMSHVLPALMRKFHETKTGTGERDAENANIESHSSIDQLPVVIWGTGTPMREFLHVDDLADACLFLMNLPEEKYLSLVTGHKSPALINIGSGEEVTIRDLALLVQEEVGHRGELLFDTDKPDGTPRKFCSVDKIRSLGWKHSIGLQEGVRSTLEWYRSRCSHNQSPLTCV